jgi:hypothetical protein
LVLDISEPSGVKSLGLSIALSIYLSLFFGNGSNHRFVLYLETNSVTCGDNINLPIVSRSSPSIKL